MLQIDIITLFPEALKQPLASSVLGRGREKRLFDINILNLRDFATDKHSTVDDTRFGGGGGMVLKVEVLSAALDSLGLDFDNWDDGKSKIIMTSATGSVFEQKQAIQLSLLKRLVIICGHYRGVDERLLSLYPITEVSIGDFILTGGEPAATVLVDAIVRLIPGVMGNFESAVDDSFCQDNLLGAPDYTRPAEFRGLKVPETLLGGNHMEIGKFRRREAIKKTFENRPDLLESADLNREDKQFLKKIENNID